MSDTSTTKRLIDDITGALATSDAEKLAEALAHLIIAQPTRWAQLLHLSNVWPEPVVPLSAAAEARLRTDLACILKASALLLDREFDYWDSSQELTQTTVGLLHLQQYLMDVAEELKKLAFVKDRVEVQLHRLLAHLEANSRTIEELASSHFAESGAVDLGHADVAAYPNQFDDSKVSLTQAFDSVCENAELGIRYILHSNALPITPDLRGSTHPFGDRDFGKFLALSALWRAAREAAANVRFRDWRWRLRNKHLWCVPSDEGECIRESAGSTRYHQFAQRSMFAAMTGSEDMQRYAASIEEVATSIVIPDQGEPWNGRADLNALCRAMDSSPLRAAVKRYLNDRHYEPVLTKLKAGDLNWNEWLDAKVCVMAIAEAMHDAATRQVPDGDSACMRQVVLIRSVDLVRTLSDCLRLPQANIERTLDVFRFDPKRKALEIWDQPLIPCSHDCVLLAPSLVTSGNPARAVENYVTQWEGVSFGVRGEPFEKYAAQELRRRSDAQVMARVSVPRTNAPNLEFDVIAWWKGHLLLIEAKCQKMVFSAADFHRAKLQVEEAIDQLITRRAFVKQHWEDLRAVAVDLNLPDACVSDDRILCIALTNIMDFTGLSRDGVIVTDDSCFFRFFEGAKIEKYTAGPGGIEGIQELAIVRVHQEPSPDELAAYLADPPQMRFLVAKMSLVRFAIPGVKTSEAGFYSVRVDLGA